MRNSELEAVVHQAIQRAHSSGQYEDARIEFKSKWPDSADEAAKRIAAHLNAARDDWAVWIIGVRPDGTVVGAAQKELANWWPQVESHFDQLAPTMLSDIHVPIGDQSVVALLFDASRAPYVIAKGNERHVFWREGTRARWATREDLFRILVPRTQRPAVEVVNAVVDSNGLNITLYVVPRTRERIFIPDHQCSFLCEDSPDFQFPPLRPQPLSTAEGATTRRSATEVVVDGAGTVYVTVPIPKGQPRLSRNVLTLGIAGQEPVRIPFEMDLVDRSWQFKKAP
jgi:hypothetical protein